MFDTIDPQAFGRFSETALGTETLTDEADGFETRLAVPDGPVLSRLAGGGTRPRRGPYRLAVSQSEGQKCAWAWTRADGGVGQKDADLRRRTRLDRRGRPGRAS
jgi:hypothetical protein